MLASPGPIPYNPRFACPRVNQHMKLRTALSAAVIAATLFSAPLYGQ